jgi:hypothetical protein
MGPGLHARRKGPVVRTPQPSRSAPRSPLSQNRVNGAATDHAGVVSRISAPLAAESLELAAIAPDKARQAKSVTPTRARQTQTRRSRPPPTPAPLKRINYITGNEQDDSIDCCDYIASQTRDCRERYKRASIIAPPFGRRPGAAGPSRTHRLAVIGLAPLCAVSAPATTRYGAQSHTPNRCVRGRRRRRSRNTRLQAACWALPGADLHRLIAPALLGAFAGAGHELPFGFERRRRQPACRESSFSASDRTDEANTHRSLEPRLKDHVERGFRCSLHRFESARGDHLAQLFLPGLCAKSRADFLRQRSR